MAERLDEGGMRYCPSCRNVMEYQGQGRYECLLCCIHVVVLDKDPDFYYEVPFTEEEREAYYEARREGIRNRVFFERERERETKKKEAVLKEQNILNKLGEGNQEHGDNQINKVKFDSFMSSRSLFGQAASPIEETQPEPESPYNQQTPQGKKCTICGKPIPSGVYCKECTFEQIKMMQRKDLGR